MLIEEDVKLDFSDVLIKPKRSTLTSRGNVSLEKTYNFKYGKAVYTGIPIIAANMDTTGTIEMHNAFKPHGLSVALHKHYSMDELFALFNTNVDYPLFYTTGITDTNHKKLVELAAKLSENDWLQYLCVDVANGYQQQFVDYIKRLRDMDLFKDTVIMAGNVVSAEIAEALVFAGADIIKTGIGGGSVCTTRVKTGVGMPQLSAVIEVADAVHGQNAHMCSDGGCTTTGDIAKAFAANADFVMLGGMLAGHEESGGGNVIDAPSGKITHKEFYGMSSTTAMNKHAGGVAKHRASEGKRVRIPYRGAVEDTIQEILGGLRSTCTYTGAETLKQLPKRTTFVKVTQTHNTVFGNDWDKQ